MSTEAYVYDAIRTPRGRGGANGALHGTKPVDLVVGDLPGFAARVGEPADRFTPPPLLLRKAERGEIFTDF
ncbi:hypothetical protein ACIQHU_01935 [Streptomyces tendae]|uniref:hypothetical protein n=1 Tax=Streptomyces tendae TaxID=1932 RepID=UPI00342983EC